MELATRNHQIAARFSRGGKQTGMNVGTEGDDACVRRQPAAKLRREIANVQARRREVENHEARRRFREFHFEARQAEGSLQLDPHTARRARHIGSTGQI